MPSYFRQSRSFFLLRLPSVLSAFTSRDSELCDLGENLVPKPPHQVEEAQPGRGRASTSRHQQCVQLSLGAVAFCRRGPISMLYRIAFFNCRDGDRHIRITTQASAADETQREFIVEEGRKQEAAEEGRAR